MFKYCFINCFTLFVFAISSSFCYSQDKCTNSTDDYLCDPGFENSAKRNTEVVHPHARSYYSSAKMEVNRCLGGSQTYWPDQTLWGQQDYWSIWGPEYYSNAPEWGLPDFLSWYTPTRGTPDYFNRYADSGIVVPYLFSVDVPNNFIGWQQPAEGDNYNGYAGIWIQPILFTDETNTYYFVTREYIQSKLKQPLLRGHQYYVSFKVNFAGKTKDPYVYQSGAWPKLALKRISAYFSHDQVITAGRFLYGSAGELMMPSYDYEQINHNDQVDQILKDTTNWMTVSDTMVASDDLYYITIGNFQGEMELQNGGIVKLPSLLPESGFPPTPIYYYIDDVNIVDLEYSDTCNCCFNIIEVVPNSSSDSAHCCYTVKVKSDSSACAYNKVVITDDYYQTSQEYSNWPNDYNRNGELELITTNYCFPRIQDGSRVKLTFTFIREYPKGVYDTLCSKVIEVKCNCECNDIWGSPSNNDKIKLYTVRNDTSCCFDLYLLNNSLCQIPLNYIKMNYNGNNFSELSFNSNQPSWSLSSNPIDKTVSFTKNVDKTILTNEDAQKIATICALPNNSNHPVSFTMNLSLGQGGNEFCDVEWHDNLKCGGSDTTCCDLIHFDLIKGHEMDSILNTNQIPGGYCCWALKAWIDQNPNCNNIKKIEVFEAQNPTIPTHVYNNPALYNSSGIIFGDVYCITEPIPGGSGVLTNYISLQIKVTFENDSICIKNINDSCKINTDYHGSEKRGDFSIDKENIINLDNITIKPNPFSDKTSIEFTLDKEEFVSLEVYNSIGDRLSTLVSSSLGKGLHKQILEGESYPNGAYYLKFTHGDKSVTIPIVKIK